MQIIYQAVIVSDQQNLFRVSGWATVDNPPADMKVLGDEAHDSMLREFLTHDMPELDPRSTRVVEFTWTETDLVFTEETEA